MPNPVKEIIFNALQNSYSDSIVIHTIDDENSAIEMDYHKITKAILKALGENNYKIVQK